MTWEAAVMDAALTSPPHCDSIALFLNFFVKKGMIATLPADGFS